MPSLPNHKHELFAQALAKGETADAAYVSAGYSPNRHNASRLKTNETVQARVAELQERAAIKVDLTIADIITQLGQDRKLARELGQPSAAVSATLGQAKVLGLLRDKVELTGKDGGPLEYREAALAEVQDIFGTPDLIIEPLQ